MKILDTERLILRTFEADDAAFHLALLNHASWIDNIGDRGVRTLEQARDALLNGPQAMQLQHGYSMYLIERKSDGLPLGVCGLIRRDTLPDTDIGYAIAAPYWGNGYAYEAAAAVLAYARDTLGLPRVLGITGPDNLASNQLLLKLGLRFQELTMLSGRDSGTNLYRIDF